LTQGHLEGMADNDLSFLKTFEVSVLQQMKDDIQTFLVNGKNRVIAEAGSGDVNVTKQWMLEPERWLKAVVWALEYNGTTTRRVTRTSMSFRC
jgi:hypothetical protein